MVNSLFSMNLKEVRLKTPSVKIDWKINLKGSAIDLLQCLIIRIGMLSHANTLSAFRFFIIKFISSSLNVTFLKLLLVLNSKESSLLLLITGMHRKVKCEVTL